MVNTNEMKGNQKIGVLAQEVQEVYFLNLLLKMEMKC